MRAIRMLSIGLALLAAACTSPESTRVQGGGPGADTGNRGVPVLMHEGALPYADTPRLIPDPAPAYTANQAARLSEQ